MRRAGTLAATAVWTFAVLSLPVTASAGGPVPDAGGEAELGVLLPVFADGFESGNVSGWNPGPGPSENCVFTPDANGFFVLNSGVTDYVVRLPVGYDVANPTPRRLLVAIHGCGDTALNFAGWAAAPWPLRPTLDYSAISIGGRDGQCWSLSDAAWVEAAIADVRACFWVHQKEIVLAGFSSGGGLAYKMAMDDAAAYAGVLIENSSLSSVVGSGNVDAVLDAAAWKLHIGHTARLGDVNYPIAGVRADWTKMLNHAFPLQSRELAGQHGDTGTDWEGFLIPMMANWAAP